MGDDDEATTRLRDRGRDDDGADWYEGSTADPRPWEAALRETETPSIREYLKNAREQGATTRALVILALALGILVIVPAALVAGMITLFLFSVVNRPLLLWAGLTPVVLVVLVVWLETR